MLTELIKSLTFIFLVLDHREGEAFLVAAAGMHQLMIAWTTLSRRFKKKQTETTECWGGTRLNRLWGRCDLLKGRNGFASAIFTACLEVVLPQLLEVAGLSVGGY